VVALRDWHDVLEPLMEWRARTTGYNITFLAYEDALSEGEGRNDAAKLKDAISKRAEASDGLVGLLLVGDAEIIPVRYVFVDILGDGNVSDPLNLRWTDDYYAYGEESTWDKDGDGVYGEDYEVMNEVPSTFWVQEAPLAKMVGRIPASTALELERFVGKLLAYEREPPPGDWYESALLISGLMDMPNTLDNPFTPDWDGGYQRESDNSYESHAQINEMLQDSFDVTWLYDYPLHHGGSWNLSQDRLDHATAVEAFDRGHALVAMNGHGYFDGSGLAHYNGSGYTNHWWDWSDAYMWRDADRAQNEGMLPWVYVAACYVGDITVPGDRTLERLVMNPTAGAVGMIAGNGENYKGESLTNASFGNWYLERAFWDLYLRKGSPSGAIHSAKRDFLSLVSSDIVPHTPLYDAYYMADYLSHNLLGDPLTRVWTEEPKALRITPLIDVNRSERVRFTVIDEDGQPVDGAFVSVVWDGGWQREWTTLSGGVELDIPLDAGELDIVVTKRNHLPLEKKVERPVTEPDIELTYLGWGDEPQSPDAPPVVGEMVELVAGVRVHGRYTYDQARVQFLVAREEGAFERLTPDVHVAISTGGSVTATHSWLPTEAGRWLVKVVVDPEGLLPDNDPSNNVGVWEVMVRGPPEWVGLPETFEVNCTSAPGSSLRLTDYLTDPDTPVDELALEARVEGSETGARVHVDGAGMLWLCPDPSAKEFSVVVTADDGTFTEEARMEVTTIVGMPKVRIDGHEPYHMMVGDIATGKLVARDTITGDVVDLPFKQLDGVEAGSFDNETGEFSFEFSRPGVFTAGFVVYPVHQGPGIILDEIILSFFVGVDHNQPPHAVDWPGFEVVEGSKGRFQLQAEDPEGDGITYSLSDDGGLNASIDPDTGVLTISTKGGDSGTHRLVVTLSDGVSEAEFGLDLFVTEVPIAGNGYGVLVGLLVALLAAGLVFWYWTNRNKVSPSEVEEGEGPKA
jgi:hypothetical protein